MTLIFLINKRVAELDAIHSVDASRQNIRTARSNLSQLNLFSGTALLSISDALSVLNYVRLVDPDSDIFKNTLTNIFCTKICVGLAVIAISFCNSRSFCDSYFNL